MFRKIKFLSIQELVPLINFEVGNCFEKLWTIFVNLISFS